jgi:thiamine transport system substrate-binding protein
MKKISLVLLSSFLFLLASCASAGPTTLTVMTHDSFAISENVVIAFEEASNVDVVFLQSGDAGTMLNKAILAKDAPLADVMFGVDNTFLSRALEADIFDAYQSPALSEVSTEFVLDSSFRALPVDYGDVCINYDKNYFEENNLAVPLRSKIWRSPNTTACSWWKAPPLLHLVWHSCLPPAPISVMAILDYWQSLKDNGVVVVDGWETAYYTNFSASSGQGPQPMVVSYASSPAAEVFFASEPLTESPTASIVAPSMCFRQIEFVGILKNGQNRDLAEKFLDFMLGKQFQEDMPLNMFVYPVNQTAQLPEVFVQHAQVADQPASITYDEIAANRDAWIEAWAEVMK